MSFMNPLSLIPPQYKIVAQLILAAVLFGSGTWVGHKITQNHYVTVITKMEVEAEHLRAEKIRLQNELDKEIAKVKEKVITKYVDKIKVIKEKEYVYREQAVNNVPDRVILSNGWLHLHNAAAGNSEADSTRSSDATPSGVEANRALGVVAENYSICHENATKLTLLQEYVREVQRVMDELMDKLNGKKQP